MDQDARSLIDDPKKRAADVAQLENENENRDRRVRERKVYRQKMEARKKARRRQRAFKLAGVWCLVIVAGFIGIAWFANEFARLIG
jgi:cell division septal protein FtsQ